MGYRRIFVFFVPVPNAAAAHRREPYFRLNLTLKSTDAGRSLLE